MKRCFKCGVEKPINEFYKHKAMKDGYLNKCKECTKQDSKDRIEIKKQDPDWQERERERSREKYHRLNYKNKYPSHASSEPMRKYREQYPEKYYATSQINNAKRDGKITVENEAHHWSYKSEHALDVLDLTTQEHNLFHRYLVYDTELFMYRTLKGVLLDSKQQHMNYFEVIKMENL